MPGPTLAAQEVQVAGHLPALVQSPVAVLQTPCKQVEVKPGPK